MSVRSNAPVGAHVRFAEEVLPSLAGLSLTGPTQPTRPVSMQAGDDSSSGEESPPPSPQNEAALDRIRQMLLGKRQRSEEREERPKTPERPRPPSRAASNASSNGGDIKCLILDFDNTLTRAVRVTLGAWSGNATSQDKDLFQAMSREDHVRNFGGAAVIEDIKVLFIQLRAIGVELRILSYGFKEAIVHALTSVQLIEFFTEPGKQPGSLVFGSDVPPLNESDEIYKALVVQEWMEEADWQPNEVAFCDDDINNIDTPERGDDNLGVAQVLAPRHAHQHEGDNFTASMQWIRDICGLTSPEAASGAAGSSSGL